MRTIIVIIDGEAFKWSSPGGGLQSLALEKVQIAEDRFSGEIEPDAMDARCFAADRALHALHNDSHLAAFGQEMREQMKPTKLSPRAAWPFPGDKPQEGDGGVLEGTNRTTGGAIGQP